MDNEMLDIDDQLAILDEIEAEENESQINDLQNQNKNNAAVSYKILQELETPAPKRRKTILKEPVADIPPQNFLNKRIPLSGDYVPVTFSDGRRLYLNMESDSTHLEKELPGKLNFCNHNPLLQDELYELVKTAENIVKLQDTIKNPLSTTPISVDSGQLWVKKYEPSGYLDLISAENINRQLLCWLKAWDYSVFGVEPKTNPLVVDDIHVDIVKTDKQPFRKPSGECSKTDHQPFQRPNDEDAIGQLDPRDGKRPLYRLVLLSGPPGIGKTTLAHLLAKHAGYQVVETNASDDRSPTAMRERLEAVVSSQSSLNRSTTPGGGGGAVEALKPSCLIVDEIDGALPAAVEVLVEAAAAFSGTSTAERRRRKKNQLVLRRPVICICNDLYAPSLRSLRAPGASCYLLRIPPIDLNRLVGRLDSIALAEDIGGVDKHFLSTLAESSGRDIRACLNALRFVKAAQSHHKRLPSLQELMEGVDGGTKDVQHNLFSAWQAVFTIPPAHILARRVNQASRRHRTERQENGSTTPAAFTTGSDSSLRARIQLTLDVCNSAGEPQSLMLGLFENYLNRRMKDASLQTVRHASDWLVYSDRLLRHILTTQDYSLMRYPAILPAWFHLSFASSAPTNTESHWMQHKGVKDGGASNSNYRTALHWPTSFIDSIAAANRTHALVDTLLDGQWRTGGTTSTLRLLTRRTFLLDAASYLTLIVGGMSTALRPVNVQLYNAREKEHLERLIGLMITIGLDWSPQTDSETGESTYRLEPPLDTVCQFGFASKSNRRFGALTTTTPASVADALPYATKQMVARELALERMRRTEAFLTGGGVETASPGQDSGPKFPLSGLSQSSAKQQQTTTNLPASFMAARIGIAAAPLDGTVKTKVKRDFFGRPIIDKPKEMPEKENQQPQPRCPINEDIWFKFKEGHSNAVRRPFLLSKLLK